MARNLFSAILLLLALFTFISAESHTQNTDAGVTPDSFFYNFELFFEDIQLNLFTPGTENKLQLETQYMSERLAEIKAMIEQENFEAAQEAAVEGNSLLEKTEEHLGELGDTQQLIELVEFTQEETTALNDILKIQHNFIQNSEEAEAIKETLLADVEEGNLDEETAALIINEVQEGVTGVETAIIKQKEDLIETTAETNDVSFTEVRIAVEEKEEELGTSEIIRADISKEEILALRTAIAKVELEVINAANEGKQNEANTMKVLLGNAKLKLQIAEDSFDRGNDWTAFEQFTAAEHLVLNADKISGKTFSQLTEEDINQIKEDLGDDAQQLKDEIERITTMNIKDWEKYKDDLIEKYPERREELEKYYEQNIKISELTKKLGDQLGAEFDKLKAEGLTDEEAATKMAERFSDEYRKAYGEDYIPPGFVDIPKEEIGTDGDIELEVIPIGTIPIGNIDDEFFNKYDEGGGFVKDNLYTDPVTGYQYIFRDDGFSYATPIGETYSVEYPENYEPKTYSRGDEVYSYIHETPEGTYTYSYTSTGYEVENPDETKEAFTYPEGKYEVVGGGEIEHKPTGFDYKSGEGQVITYDYNPEFKHYVASDGKVYVPPEGTSYHSENIHYESSGKTYSYSYGGENWNYNPEKNVWTSSTGEKYTPSAITGAPVGYEDRKTFTTEKGETWTYDESSGTWKSSSGEEYTPPPSSYYAYDSSSGSYTDYQGNTWTRKDDGAWVSSTGETREPTQEGYTSSFADPSGKSWSYDSNAGVWKSSTGESYNPYTGTTTDSSGQSVDTYSSGGYQSSYSGSAYTDGSGKTWSYDSSSGVWSSSTGESYSAPSGATSQYSGTDSSGATWSQNPDGSWSSSTGGSYSGSGAYSGGDSGSYGGGSYSGGDSGGGGSYSGGGDAGGGGTGYATKDFTEEERSEERVSKTFWGKYTLF